MNQRRNRKSTGFGTPQIKALALAAVIGASWIAGTHRAEQRFGAQGEPPAARVTHATPAAAEPSPPDSPGWDLPNPDHPRVDDFVRMFTTGKRDEFARYLERSGRYAPMISAKLAERGMPQDLIYLAMIESGFNPRAYSHAHASGLWQFIRETGERYGLDVNRAVDERRDPVAATDAALTYLQQLYERFGSWYLAAAAYNTGENRVGRIMREVTGSERGDDADYFAIRDRLPRETRDYVPLMIAAARIAKEPARYGFEDVELEEPLAYEEVVVEPATPLRAIARAAGTTVEEIRRLNPHFKLDRTRNDRPAPVRLPVGSGERFAERWPRVRREVELTRARAPAEEKTRSYRVRRGDNLTKIARRHGVTVRSLRRANGLRSDRIRAGSVLRIPG